MFDVDRLSELVSKHGRVVRVVVASALGSVPRDVGASMCVWSEGQSGTIGGGMLEYQSTTFARELLQVRTGDWIRQTRKMPLGPALGQCCGGAVTVLAEVYGQDEVDAVKRLAACAPVLSRNVASGTPPNGKNDKQKIEANEMAEDFAKPGLPLWVYGAGHVGRALVHALAPLGFDISWIETGQARYPDELPDGVRQLVSADPARSVRYAPKSAHHLIVTCSHALDLEICHALLSHGFLSAGLIGSSTKWAKFQKRLENLGHGADRIAQITCPIGMPELGKSPEAIAVGVAAELLKDNLSAGVQASDLKEYAS